MMSIRYTAQDSIAVVLARNYELDLILKAIDVASATSNDPLLKEDYGDLRAELVEARHGKRK